MNMNKVLTLIVWATPDGQLIGFVKEMPGVSTFAKTEKELLSRIGDAVAAMSEHLASSSSNWEHLPLPQSVNARQLSYTMA